MEYISVREAAAKWGITGRMVNYYCSSGRIIGAQKIANVWVIPRDAAQPDDRRKEKARRSAKKNPHQETTMCF